MKIRYLPIKMVTEQLLKDFRWKFWFGWHIHREFFKTDIPPVEISFENYAVYGRTDIPGYRIPYRTQGSWFFILCAFGFIVNR